MKQFGLMMALASSVVFMACTSKEVRNPSSVGFAGSGDVGSVEAPTAGINKAQISFIIQECRNGSPQQVPKSLHQFDYFPGHMRDKSHVVPYEVFSSSGTVLSVLTDAGDFSGSGMVTARVYEHAQGEHGGKLVAATSLMFPNTVDWSKNQLSSSSGGGFETQPEGKCLNQADGFIVVTVYIGVL